MSLQLDALLGDPKATITLASLTQAWMIASTWLLGGVPSSANLVHFITCSIHESNYKPLVGGWEGEAGPQVRD